MDRKEGRPLLAESLRRPGGKEVLALHSGRNSFGEPSDWLPVLEN